MLLNMEKETELKLQNYWTWKIKLNFLEKDTLEKLNFIQKIKKAI